jgi:nitroimidazol reductase NimA-like FMN-containing flavoprotein (pyridoxamine 5'-phosphate oxidase superfamily)
MSNPSGRDHFSARPSVYKRVVFNENGAVKKRNTLNAQAVIRRLLARQKLGVLATREPSTPYQSLVAFAVSRDLRHIYFATAAHTRKHANLVRFPQASMLFDNRRNVAADFNRGIAVTAMGRTEPVRAGSKKEAVGLYLRKHPTLKGFVKSPSCRIFQVKVKTYILVTEFQQVITYNPTFDRSKTP